MLLRQKRKWKIPLDCEMMMREEKMVRRRCLGRRSRVREEENQQQELLRRWIKIWWNEEGATAAERQSRSRQSLTEMNIHNIEMKNKILEWEGICQGSSWTWDWRRNSGRRIRRGFDNEKRREWASRVPALATISGKKRLRRRTHWLMDTHLVFTRRIVCY